MPSMPVNPDPQISHHDRHPVDLHDTAAKFKHFFATTEQLPWKGKYTVFGWDLKTYFTIKTN